MIFVMEFTASMVNQLLPSGGRVGLPSMDCEIIRQHAIPKCRAA